MQCVVIQVETKVYVLCYPSQRVQSFILRLLTLLPSCQSYGVYVVYDDCPVYPSALADD